MRVSEFIEEHFWVFLLLGMALGFLIPATLRPLTDYLIPLLMAVLCITFLRIDITDLAVQARRPGLLLYVLIVNLVIIPLVCFVLTRGMELDLRIGLVLLAALPSGTAAPALTEIIRGRTSLALMMTVLSTLITPVSIPLILYGLFGATVGLRYLDLFFQLLLFIVIPLGLAQGLRRLSPVLVERGRGLFGPLMVALIMLIAMAVIAREAPYIRTHLSEMAFTIAILFALFALLQLAGYFTAFWLPQEERIALSISKMAMNNVLGVVIAMGFFNSRVALILILSELPWNTLPALSKLYRRYLP